MPEHVEGGGDGPRWEWTTRARSFLVVDSFEADSLDYVDALGALSEHTVRRLLAEAVK